MKKTFAILLALIMLLTAAVSVIPASAAARNITPNDYWTADAEGKYRISNPADLLAFSSNAALNNYYAGKTVMLTNDIDMKDIEWFMVENFKGTFDGNGYAIKNLSVSAAGEIAFIKNFTGATMKNIRFLNASVTATTSNAASIVARCVIGNSLFENVYVNGTVTTANTRAAGFVAYNAGGTADAPVVTTFRNCVSDVVVKGKERGAGFVSQTNAYGEFVFEDCVFTGDLSGIGRWSGGIMGLTMASKVTMTRCMVLGTLSKNKEAGAFMFLDHQNNATISAIKSEITLNDCYAVTTKLSEDKEGNAVWQTPVGAEGTSSLDAFGGGPRSWPVEVKINYGGTSVGSFTGTKEAPLCNLKGTIEGAVRYVAKDAEVLLTKDNFATNYTAFSAEDKWVVCGDETVTYAEGKTVAKVMPAVTKALIAGESVVEVPYDETVDYFKLYGYVWDAVEEEEEEEEFEEYVEPEDETEAATEAATEAETEAEEKKGCGSVIGGSAAVLCVAVGGALAFTFKKKED